MNLLSAHSYNCILGMDLANGNPAGNENGSNSSHSDEVQVAGDVEDAAASESR